MKLTEITQNNSYRKPQIASNSKIIIKYSLILTKNNLAITRYLIKSKFTNNPEGDLNGQRMPEVRA